MEVRWLRAWSFLFAAIGNFSLGFAFGSGNSMWLIGVFVAIPIQIVLNLVEMFQRPTPER